MHRHHVFKVWIATLAAGASTSAQWGQAAQLFGRMQNAELGDQVVMEGPLLAARGLAEGDLGAEDWFSIFELNAGQWQWQETPDLGGLLPTVDIVADLSNGTLVVSRLTSCVCLIVLDLVAGVWTVTQTLDPPLGPSGEPVAYYDVAISGDTIMATAADSSNSSTTLIDVFRRAASGWAHEGRLTVPQTAVLREVDISGDVAVAMSTVLVDGPLGWEIGVALQPDDGTPISGSAGVSGDTIVLGAYQSDNYAGSAYVFERSGDGSWAQIKRLTAPRPQDGARFGRSLDISGGAIVIGEYTRTIKGKASAGAAHVFEERGGAWAHAAELAPADGAGANYRFGSDVSISGGLVAVGCPQWGFMDSEPGGPVTNGPGAIYIYGCAQDTDGDGLCDDWETGGIPYYDQFGDLQHYMLPGADPLRKDLYVEVDIMAGAPFMQGAIDDVVGAFANAPVNNADPSTGITLHVLVDEMNLPFKDAWDDKFDDFDNSKDAHFGTVVEHGNEELLAAKALAYRYCQWVNKFAPSGAVGWGELRGNDFTVAFAGLPEEKRTREIMASTWMHELGHNLNLRHGGADDVNYKPNHVSVMNYAFDDYLKLVGTELVSVPIDFSREATQALLESSLNEQIGINSALYSDVLTFYSTGNPMIPFQGVALDGSEIDYDGDDETDTEPVQKDLNNFDGANKLEALIVDNEWELIILGLGGDGDYLDRQHTTLPPSELDVATILMLDDAAAIAFADCLADLDGDGNVGGSDLAALLANWGAGGSADLSGDGVVDGADLAALLASWGSCS